MIVTLLIVLMLVVASGLYTIWENRQ